MKLKVLHFHKGNYFKTFGGIERMVFELTATMKNDCESTIISISDFKTENQIINNVNFINFKKDFSIFGSPISFEAFKFFYKKQGEYDIVNLHYPDLNNDFLALLIKKPLVLTYHSDIIGYGIFFNIYKFFRKILFSKISKIVFTSPNYLKSTQQITNKIKNKSCVIPIGISSFETENLNRKFDCNFFLIVCQLRKYKGLDLLFKLDTSKFKIVVVGGGKNLSVYRKRAKKFKKNIEFLGNLSEKEKNYYLKNCIAVLSTSNMRSEAFGVSLLEGIMNGKPVVSAANNTGTSMINTHGINGFEFEKGNSNSLQKYLNILNDDIQLREEMGLESLDKYKKNFTSKKMAKSYLMLYREIT